MIKPDELNYVLINQSEISLQGNYWMDYRGADLSMFLWRISLSPNWNRAQLYLMLVLLSNSFSLVNLFDVDML